MNVQNSIPVLIGWRTYRKSIVSTNRLHKSRRMLACIRLFIKGFTQYTDALAVRFHVNAGDTPLSIARMMFAELQADKPIDPADPRVIWTTSVSNNGMLVMLYYKFNQDAR